MRRHSILRPRALGLGAGIAVLAATAWLLAASLATPVSSGASQAEPTPGTAALRVAIQPETGDLVPALVRPELDALGFSEPAGNLVIHTRPDGALHADIRGHFMSYSVARRTPSGHIDQTCVSDPQTVRQLLQATPTPPVATGEEE